MYLKTQLFSLTLLWCLCFSPTLFSQTILLDEDFSAGSLPTGWTNVDNGATGQIWQFNNPAGRSIGGDFDSDFVIIDSDNYGNGGSQNATLTTSAFSFSAGPLPVYLEYDYQYRECCGSVINVELYNGSSWQQIASYTGNPNYNGTGHEQINLRNYVNSVANAQIRFTYAATWGYWMAIDNLTVYSPLDTDGDG